MFYDKTENSLELCRVMETVLYSKWKYMLYVLLIIVGIEFISWGRQIKKLLIIRWIIHFAIVLKSGSHLCWDNQIFSEMGLLVFTINIWICYTHIWISKDFSVRVCWYISPNWPNDQISDFALNSSWSGWELFSTPSY